MTTIATTKTINIGVKLDASLHARLKTLSLGKDRTSHWLMKTAIEEYVAREERNEREKVEDMERWERYQLTGQAVPHDDAEAWLSSWGSAMANVNVRNIPDAVHRALPVRTAHHGHSTEAEIREILEAAARPPERIKLGSLLASIAREAGGLSEAEAEGFIHLRDKTPDEPMRFE